MKALADLLIQWQQEFKHTPENAEPDPQYYVAKLAEYLKDDACENPQEIIESLLITNDWIRKQSKRHGVLHVLTDKYAIDVDALVLTAIKSKQTQEIGSTKYALATLINFYAGCGNRHESQVIALFEAIMVACSKNVDAFQKILTECLSPGRLDHANKAVDIVHCLYLACQLIQSSNEPFSTRYLKVFGGQFNLFSGIDLNKLKVLLQMVDRLSDSIDEKLTAYAVLEARLSTESPLQSKLLAQAIHAYIVKAATIAAEETKVAEVNLHA